MWWEKILPWVGGIFAAVGLILIFFDVISSIKRRDKTRTNIAGLVLLAVAVVGYVITDLILKDSAWPPLASLVWIVLFWVYVILDACVTMGKIKTHRREKKAAAAIAKKEEETDADEQDDSVSTETVATVSEDTGKSKKKRNKN